eukprot:s6517_g6.t1
MNTLSRLVPLLNKFGVTKTWKLGRVLPGQRRGAQEWYHYAGQVHVDDMMATGDQLAQDRVENHHGPNAWWNHATALSGWDEDTAGAAKMPVKRNDTMYGTERKKCDKKLKQHEKEELWKNSEERSDVLKHFTWKEQKKRRYV